VGSGALYLEALSRGASSGLALDNNSAAVSSLREHLGTLRCSIGKAAKDDALRYLETQPAEQFDVIFLDPPFHQNLLVPACTLLEERNWLADNAWIYTESETAPSTLGLPGNWRLHREKKAGQVHYALWERSVAAA
jgi:16S rRNA (guanine966-N2)-methyltransferase